MFSDAPSWKASVAPASRVSEPLFKWYSPFTATAPHSRVMTRFTLSAPARALGHSVSVDAELSSPPDEVDEGAAAAPRLAGVLRALGVTAGARVCGPCACAGSFLPPQAATQTRSNGARRTSILYYGIARRASAMPNSGNHARSDLHRGHRPRARPL